MIRTYTLLSYLFLLLNFIYLNFVYELIFTCIAIRQRCCFSLHRQSRFFDHVVATVQGMALAIVPNYIWHLRKASDNLR